MLWEAPDKIKVEVKVHYATTLNEVEQSRRVAYNRPIALEATRFKVVAYSAP